MKKEEYLLLMQFPQEWILWDMYPDELCEIQVSGYEFGHEQASEHDRNGAFHWWLRQEPDQSVLMKLLKLTLLDPDKHMAADVRSYICRAKNADQEVLAEAKKAS